MSTASTHAPAAPAGRPGAVGWSAWFGAAAICTAATLIGLPLADTLDTASLVLLFILAVVLSGARFGRGPAVLAACLSVLFFNVVFVAPRFSLAVADERLVFTLVVMLLVGLIVGHLTASLRAQARAAADGEALVRHLYDISRELGTALTVQQVDEVARHFLLVQLGAQASLWVRNPDAAQVSPAAVPAALEARAMQAMAGARQDPSGWPVEGAMVVALRGPMAVRGAMVLQRPGALPWSEGERRLIDACAALIGSALERIHYVEVARASAVDVEGERLRNVLLSAISHDLRTPLASLVGLAESLALTRPLPTPQQAGIAQSIAGSARRMSAMVNNLLDMARVESGAVRLRLEWLPVEEVIGTAVAACEPSLADHHLDIRVPDDMPLCRFDAVLMERVLVNLLENAARYTPAGSTITIAAACHPDELWLSVSDDGPGFGTHRPQDLFRKFERGDRESNTPGVGLGLALCRAVVEAHGGRIRAEAGEGGGARFVIVFPRATPPEMPAEATLLSRSP
ncbi:DUF4118 domain-containing protein [Hydrogenophaga sp.]|uniref:DUF4118 domain-containing protein n=1 Tax=Hydrogenophaga sp. TaxID=1904254 RepID=UPI003D0B9B36